MSEPKKGPMGWAFWILAALSVTSLICSAGTLCLYGALTETTGEDHREPPLGVVVFCILHSDDCRDGEPRALGEKERRTVERINAEVNSEITYRPAGESPSWQILPPGSTGNCTDFTLTKLDRLLKAGIAPGALSIAWLHVVGAPDNLYHLVLLAWFQDGVKVLDYDFDQIDDVRQYDRFEWMLHQEFGHPRHWVAGTPKAKDRIAEE